MKMYVYPHEVSNSIKVVYDYYVEEHGTKLHKQRDFWVRYFE